MIDMVTKKLHKIEIPLEENNSVELCRNHSFVFIDTKIVFTGGISKEGDKLNNLISSFDISLYKFENEKVRENNMIPRHSHGSVSIFDIIYLIGGFTTKDEDKVCNKIQATKFDNMMNNWMEVSVQGNQPELLVKPVIKYDIEHLICYSDYLYPKIWYMKFKTSTGFMVDLSKIGIPNFKNSIFSYYNGNSEKTEKEEKSGNLEKNIECEILILNETNLSLNNFKFSLVLNN
jgi:hypothetical protein